MRRHHLINFRKNTSVWILFLYLSVIGLTLLFGWYFFQETILNILHFLDPKPGKDDYWAVTGQQLIVPFIVLHLGLGSIGWVLFFSKPRLAARGRFLDKDDDHSRFNLLLTSSFLSLYIFGLYTIPEFFIRKQLDYFKEDSFFEYFTSINFFISGFLFFLIILYIWKDSQSSKKFRLVFFFLILVLVCIFIAGEEISWGQRIFRWGTPEQLINKNMQKESNLHNLLPRLVLLEWGAGIFFSIILFGIWLGISESQRERLSLIVPPNELRITAIIAVSSSGHGNPELFEILISLLILFSSISILKEWRDRIRRSTQISS